MKRIYFLYGTAIVAGLVGVSIAMINCTKVGINLAIEGFIDKCEKGYSYCLLKGENGKEYKISVEHYNE